MLIGCVLVVLILIAFLFEWRTALISLTAIPLSIISAVLLLNRLGGTLNTMVLAGLAIAVGEVVDDAIIDVENIMRRLRQNRTAAQPLSDLNGQVDPARARHDPAKRHVRQKLSVLHPMAALDDLVVEPCRGIAAKARHTQPKERGRDRRQSDPMVLADLGVGLGGDPAEPRLL